MLSSCQGVFNSMILRIMLQFERNYCVPLIFSTDNFDHGLILW